MGEERKERRGKSVDGMLLLRQVKSILDGGVRFEFLHVKGGGLGVRERQEDGVDDADARVDECAGRSRLRAKRLLRGTRTMFGFVN